MEMASVGGYSQLRLLLSQSYCQQYTTLSESDSEKKTGEEERGLQMGRGHSTPSERKRETDIGSVRVPTIYVPLSSFL